MTTTDSANFLDTLPANLFSLRDKHSYHSEIRAMISVMAMQTKRTVEWVSWNNKQFSMCLGALRDMNSDYAEVRSLLSALAPHIECFKGTLSGDDAAMCLHSLQGLSTEYDDVKVLLGHLTRKILHSNPSFSVKNIRDAFLGLQHLSPDDVNVNKLLLMLQSQLMHIVENHNGSVNYKRWGPIVYSLACLCSRSKRFRRESDGFIGVVIDQGVCIVESDQSIPHENLRIMLRLSHLLAHTLDNKILLDKLNAVIALLESKIKKCSVLLKDSSILEKKIYQKIQRNLPKDMRAYHNKDFHGFDTDIMLYKGNRIINIEIDGPTHLIPRKANFSRMRDQWMHDVHNVQVIRINFDNGYADAYQKAADKCIHMLRRKQIL
jgi:hypothetical protein